MYLITGVVLLVVGCLGSVEASPVLIMNTDGSLNTTYAPYAVLAALGYGAVTLAGVHAYQLWAPVIERNNLKAVPDPEVAKNNRLVMSSWLRQNVGDPGSSSTLESLRQVVATLIPKRRADSTRPIRQPQTDRTVVVGAGEGGPTAAVPVVARGGGGGGGKRREGGGGRGVEPIPDQSHPDHKRGSHHQQLLKSLKGRPLRLIPVSPEEAHRRS